MKKNLQSIIAILSLTIMSLRAEGPPSGLKKGEKAPDFETKDMEGKTFKLSTALKKGEVVLIFYRGQWCPFCNKYLSAIQDSLSMIQSKGATVVAISPETYESVKQTIEKTKASYPVIYDEGMKVMNLYKVKYSLDAPMIETFKGYGIDFIKANGENGANLPVPATYIVSKDGKIKYVFFNPDFKQRASVKEILANLK